MDSGHSNETEWPNNTLLTYTLPADGQGEGERGHSAHQKQDLTVQHIFSASLKVHVTRKLRTFLHAYVIAKPDYSLFSHTCPAAMSADFNSSLPDASRSS